jgi:hypothetical protein
MFLRPYQSGTVVQISEVRLGFWRLVRVVPHRISILLRARRQQLYRDAGLEIAPNTHHIPQTNMRPTFAKMAGGNGEALWVLRTSFIRS